MFSCIRCSYILIRLLFVSEPGGIEGEIAGVKDADRFERVQQDKNYIDERVSVYPSTRESAMLEPFYELENELSVSEGSERKKIDGDVEIESHKARIQIFPIFKPFVFSVF